MRVLVTGGAGFIGSHSVDLLLAQGHEVRVLDNLASGKRENLSPHQRLELRIGDIRDAEAVAAAVEGMDAVLHLAAQVFVPTSIERPAFSSSVNVAGFVTVLDAARRAGVKRFAYASSAAVYGVPDALPVNEATPPSSLSPYALEKLINDQYAKLFNELYGMSTCGLRYFNVYGPRQDPRSAYSGVISKFCERVAADATLTVFGDGLQTRDFIAVSDVARANVAALMGQTLGVVNVATGTSVTLLQLIDALSGLVGRALVVEHAPTRAGEVRESSVTPDRLRRDLGAPAASTLSAGLRSLLLSLGVPCVDA